MGRKSRMKRERRKAMEALPQILKVYDEMGPCPTSDKIMAYLAESAMSKKQ